MTVNKILYLLLPMILLLGVYGSQISYEKTGYFVPYKVQKSNDAMIFSIDKSSYQQGQTINFTGKVSHYNQGAKVDIRIFDPSKNIVERFSSLLNSYGIFGGTFSIPTSFSEGKYVLDAHYQGDSKGKPLALDMTISNLAKGKVYISIPYGASSESNKINFVPLAMVVQQGAIITWENHDITVHTVISGKISDDGTIHPDGLFQGGFIGPGSKLVISPKPGNYTYFCKLHPWLDGKISVKPNVSVKPAATPAAKPTTVPDSVLQSIWKDRKDLQKLYPEAAKGNLTGLKKWASTTGWAQYDSLLPLAPPPKPTTVPDSVLQSIWKDRKDLQKLYPEAAKGNLTGLKKWASTTGWAQYDSLLPLAPKSVPNPPKAIVLDSKAIPTVFYGNSIGYQYNPVTISNWINNDCAGFVETKNTTKLQCIKNNANWLVANAKPFGNYSLYEYHFPFRYNLSSPWHSALAQGFAISALTKAYKITSNHTYLDATNSLLNSFYVDVKNGGITEKTVGDGWWYEEYAGKNGTNPRVLNGHMYDLVALHDYYNSTGTKKADYLFKQGVLALKNHISSYDNNGSSYYDSEKYPVDAYYQKVHVELTGKLYNITGESIFKKYHDKWELYEKSHPSSK